MLLDNDKIRLNHILRATSEILEFCRDKELGDLKSDIPLSHLVLRNLEIIGEAAARVSPAFRDTHPQVPWREMTAMRNRIIHDYMNVNLDIIWRTVQTAIPALHAQLSGLYQELP